MKTLGLIGGMSWESTRLYYSLINETIHQKLGKNHSAKCLLYSFDFQEIEEAQFAGDWELLRRKIFEAGKILKNAGAHLAVLCTNTMHKVVDGFQEAAGIPLLHIADAAGKEITAEKIKKVGLLGTRFTMEQDFYKSILTKKYGLEVVIPENDDRDTVHRIIYEELVKGIFLPSSRKKYEDILFRLHQTGAEGMVLGCTEIGLLIQQSHFPLFDTATIHARDAVRAMLE